LAETVQLLLVMRKTDTKNRASTASRCVRVDSHGDPRYNAPSSASELFPDEFLGDQRVRLIATTA
jgi:hypothetical protein